MLATLAVFECFSCLSLENALCEIVDPARNTQKVKVRDNKELGDKYRLKPPWKLAFHGQSFRAQGSHLFDF